MEYKLLSDITTKIGSGATPKGGSSAYQDSGISLIRSQNVLDFKFSKDGLAYINKLQADKLNNVTVQKDDVLLNITGDSIARTCIVPDEILPARVNQHVSIIRSKAGYNPRYIHYYLMNMKPYLLQICGVGGTRNALTKEALLKLPIKISHQQNKIAKVLSDLDAKIELNNRINTELEAMAKMLYDYWFLQFDFPDSNGKPYKTSRGKMVWNEDLKRDIPEGWEVNELGNILNTDLGGTPSTKIEKFWGGNIPWLNSGEIANFPIVESEAHITTEAILNSATTLMPAGTCVLSITRHLRPSILAIEACANQSVVGIFESEKFKSSFIYPYLKNEIPRLMTLRSGAQQPHINKGTVDESLMIDPSILVLEKYYKKANPIYKQIINNSFQNQELSSLRDWLLPMLMNGQVSVNDEEEELGMVAEPVVEYKEIKTNKTRTDKSEAFLKKVMLGCHLVYRFHQEREFGHIKFMKLLYLCEQVGEMNLMTNYQKAAAGPFDKKTLASIEKYIQTSGWFKINKEPYTGSNGKVYERTFYSLTGKSTDYQKYYNNYFESEKDKIEKLIQLFKGANSKKCEIVATTYYAYNELLKKNVLINENSLIKGFFEFHPQKGKNFKEFDVKEQLPWMKNNGVYPKRQID
ncbi:MULTISPECIES: restriction endonuclease subunit S [Flavobacterium]|uniref:Restriction endonuclease subunit S n=1 Tax=Flavobacterium algoritolerans TaxID=3041254 RepID=A0ABT6VBP6_9FLAO|nr:restriction endonuclease subunit S [Flavobacterium algoritolerans]MDI5895346.1 restriction endonuclease subunit S [Flavobacterium algoritolerans]